MEINMDKVNEMDGHWNEVMDLAVKYGFVCQAFAGTATLLTHKNQIEVFKEAYLCRQKEMNGIDMSLH